MTGTKEDRILQLVKKLPKEFIEEYEIGILPYERQTIEKIKNFFNRKLGLSITCDKIGYAEDVLKNIDSFYKELCDNNLI